MDIQETGVIYVRAEKNGQKTYMRAMSWLQLWQNFRIFFVISAPKFVLWFLIRNALARLLIKGSGYIFRGNNFVITKLFCLPLEKGSTQKGKNLLLLSKGDGWTDRRNTICPFCHSSNGGGIKSCLPYKTWGKSMNCIKSPS